EKRFAQAKDLGRKGQLHEGLELLQGALRASEKSRERFLWRFASARLLLEADRPDLGKAQLERLDEELGRTSAAEWDPALAVDVLCALLDCHDKLGARRGKADGVDAA